MAEERSISPSAQPAVGTGEDKEQVIAQFFALPERDQVQCLRALVPRIMGRLSEVDVASFLKHWRRAPAGDARMATPGASDRPPLSRDEVIGDVLRQPIGTQFDILNRVAPRILARFNGHDRDLLLRALEYEITGAELGEARF